MFSVLLSGPLINSASVLAASAGVTLVENSYIHQKEDARLIQDLRGNENSTRPKKIYGGIVDADSISMLEERRSILFPLSLIIHNTKPVGHQVAYLSEFMLLKDNTWERDLNHVILPMCLFCLLCESMIYFFVTLLYDLMQDLVGLIISMLLLGDFSLVLLTLLQLYSISLADDFLVLFILPFGILLPFPAGINALFSHGPRRSAGLARVYALWNITSLINVVSHYVHYFTFDI